jgi:hypothetical protein
VLLSNQRRKFREVTGPFLPVPPREDEKKKKNKKQKPRTTRKNSHPRLLVLQQGLVRIPGFFKNPHEGQELCPQ